MFCCKYGLAFCELFSSHPVYNIPKPLEIFMRIRLRNQSLIWIWRHNKSTGPEWYTVRARYTVRDIRWIFWVGFLEILREREREREREISSSRF